MDKAASICLAIKEQKLSFKWNSACRKVDLPVWEIHTEAFSPDLPCALIVADAMEQLTAAFAYCTQRSRQKENPLKILLLSNATDVAKDILRIDPASGPQSIANLLQMAYNSYLYLINADNGVTGINGSGTPGLSDGTQLFLEQSLFGVVVLQEKQIRLLNDKARELIGIQPGLSIRKLVLRDFIPADQADNFRQIMMEIISGKLSGKIFSIPVISARQENIVLQAWLSRVSYKGAPALLIFFTDMGELLDARKRGRKYEVEYFRIHKMAMVGKLASGLAHNLNTPVSIIQGNAELLELKYPDSREIGMILKQTARLGREIHLLGMRGNKDLSTSEEEVDLNVLIKNEMAFLDANLYFKHYVKCKLDLQKNLPKILGVYSDFSQLLSEIIENAIDAMYGLDKRKITIKTDRRERYVRLTISDSGKGMDRNTLEHLFEPFFTTKVSPDESTPSPNEPHGTGLGLPMALSILTKYNGEVTVDSKPGAGTVFTILLPSI